MATKGEKTREHVLAVAERIILQRGYSGTSIEDIIGEAGITKGGFFYHFDGKNDLARQLVLRYLKQDEEFFEALFERARSLTEDPLQQMLIMLKLLAEAMADLPSAHPGCLVASFTYESQQFDDEIRALMAKGLYTWREMFLEQLQRAADVYPPQLDCDLVEMADMLIAVVEGAIIVSRSLDDRHILPNQLLLYRNYVRMTFGDVGTRAARTQASEISAARPAP